MDISKIDECASEASICLQSTRPCEDYSQMVNITITADLQPHKIRWKLTNEDGIDILKGGPYMQTKTDYHSQICPTPGKYTFTINSLNGYKGGWSSYKLIIGNTIMQGSNKVSDLKTFTVQYLAPVKPSEPISSLPTISTFNPTPTPTFSNEPSNIPSIALSTSPSIKISNEPSNIPSIALSTSPSIKLSNVPSNMSSIVLSTSPSIKVMSNNLPLTESPKKRSTC